VGASRIRLTQRQNYELSAIVKNIKSNNCTLILSLHLSIIKTNINMENQPTPIWKHALMYGIYTGAALIVLHQKYQGFRQLFFLQQEKALFVQILPLQKS